LARHVARIADIRNADDNSIGKPEVKGPLERSKRRRKSNIKMDLNEIGREGLDLAGSGCGPMMESCEHGFYKRRVFLEELFGY